MISETARDQPITRSYRPKLFHHGYLPQHDWKKCAPSPSSRGGLFHSHTCSLWLVWPNRYFLPQLVGWQSQRPFKIKIQPPGDLHVRQEKVRRQEIKVDQRPFFDTNVDQRPFFCINVQPPGDLHGPTRKKSIGTANFGTDSPHATLQTILLFHPKRSKRAVWNDRVSSVHRGLAIFTPLARPRAVPVLLPLQVSCLAGGSVDRRLLHRAMATLPFVSFLHGQRFHRVF